MAKRRLDHLAMEGTILSVAQRKILMQGSSAIESGICG